MKDNNIINRNDYTSNLYNTINNAYLCTTRYNTKTYVCTNGIESYYCEDINNIPTKANWYVIMSFAPN